MVPAVSDHSIQSNNTAYTNSLVSLVFCTKNLTERCTGLVTYSGLTTQLPNPQYLESVKMLLKGGLHTWALYKATKKTMIRLVG